MASENLDLTSINEARRQALAKSVQPITLEELKALGEKLFPFLDHPWRQQFFGFLEQNPHGKFHHATTNDRIEIVYCQDQDKGIWFLPGGGTGPLQEAGLKVMKEITTARK